ncbi:NAD(P)-dependent oxidoreductase [Aspergillus clavatus NRRL 1]|uniref:NAD(P)-binding domain-containing protein n=1 Tax=Aspergillus clavatus (strain ATCC 1007 / CBS 513.65 / DSM 816 / NCTC 3887 / NRRL 1 / QM 1276 / 107) TaxID=344612 RepID=A1CDZ3_ASPCL|nr:uncharacterized protein ACLA_008300 [Aspergillus clavatus NRRL 1]EAW12070.1 conserved hypothetical protein [Aspergillus clavatus NRRL 1]
MPSEKPTIAFFGATGGCVLACLVLALESGYRCTALVRNPSKLHGLLRRRGVSESIVTDKLFVVTGNVMDLEAVQRTLLYRGHPVDLIISGIGGQMRFDTFLRPTIDNPTICQDAIRTILTATRSSMNKPRLVVLSTTGISSGRRDVPLAMWPMYHWMLKVPHEDKRVMESLILEEANRPGHEKGVQDYIVVRASLLHDGGGNGLGKIKEGTEESPLVGYVISRKEVGLWLFEKTVRPYGQDNSYWGKIVTITT